MPLISKFAGKNGFDLTVTKGMNVVLSHDKRTVFVKGAASVHHVENLYTGLKEILNQANIPLVIDLSGLTSIDVSGAQVFVSLRLSNGAESIKYIKCPEPPVRKLARVGLARHLFGSVE